MNYLGLAQLGWRATQTISGKNGYHDWEQMSDIEKQILNRRWEEISQREKDRLVAIVAAACDAFARAIAV